MRTYLDWPTGEWPQPRQGHPVRFRCMCVRRQEARLAGCRTGASGNHISALWAERCLFSKLCGNAACTQTFCQLLPRNRNPSIFRYSLQLPWLLTETRTKSHKWRSQSKWRSTIILLAAQQTRDGVLMLGHSWPTVYVSGSALAQHRDNVACLLGNDASDNSQWYNFLLY